MQLCYNTLLHIIMRITVIETIHWFIALLNVTYYRLNYPWHFYTTNTREFTFRSPLPVDHLSLATSRRRYTPYQWYWEKDQRWLQLRPESIQPGNYVQHTSGLAVVDPDGVSASELERTPTNFWLRMETVTRWNSTFPVAWKNKNLVVNFDTGSLFHFISYGNLLDLSIKFSQNAPLLGWILPRIIICWLNLWSSATLAQSISKSSLHVQPLPNLKWFTRRISFETDEKYRIDGLLFYLLEGLFYLTKNNSYCTLYRNHDIFLCSSSAREDARCPPNP